MIKTKVFFFFIIYHSSFVWKRLVFMENLQSKQSKTETRPSKNASCIHDETKHPKKWSWDQSEVRQPTCELTYTQYTHWETQHLQSTGPMPRPRLPLVPPLAWRSRLHAKEEWQLTKLAINWPITSSGVYTLDSGSVRKTDSFSWAASLHVTTHLLFHSGRLHTLLPTT